MCTVLLRFDPAAAWPVLLAAVRDEFLDRAWDPPGQYWPEFAPTLTGGRDRTAGGTWLAARGRSPAVAAVLNGRPLPPPDDPRPSRGTLPVIALTTTAGPATDDLRRYDAAHLLLATPDAVTMWSWDGRTARRHEIEPGHHIAVNAGLDAVDDPLVPHFMPLLRATPTPPLHADQTEAAWRGWVDLLRGDGLAEDDPRALLVRHVHEGRTYGSSSATLVAVGRDEVRMDFTATPFTPAWKRVPVPSVP